MVRAKMSAKKTDPEVRRERPGPTKTDSAARRSDIDELLAAKRHPLEEEIRTVRRVILGVDASIREEIKWSSVSFRNEHDFFATVNLRSTESVQLVLYTGVAKKATAETGVRVADPMGLIEKWPAKDRCLVTLGKGATFDGNRAALAALVKDWLPFVR